MDHLIGQRFSLISKSEIRYVGTLHEINPEQSTISLEDVYSFGTEDRNPSNFVAPSQQKFDYIVFRGSDVKDIKVAEENKENEQPSPPAVPNDPAILNSSRAGPPPAPAPNQREPSPLHYGGYHGPPPPQFGQYPPPPPGQFGRGYGPPMGAFGGPGPQFYPPPPGYYGGPPPPQPFPQGRGQFPQGRGHFHPQGPPAVEPPESRGPVASSTPSVPAPQTSELPDNKVPPSKQPSAVPAAVPAEKPVAPSEPPKAVESTPGKVNRVAPAVPFTVNQKSFIPPVANDRLSSSTNGNTVPAPNPAVQPSLEDASRQAKAAVAEAMAKLNPQSAQSKPIPTAEAIDALTRKVSAMGTAGPTAPRGRGGSGYRGGRGARTTSGGRSKIEIPQSDYDFETANAKFNKEDLIKEAIATGSPVGETPDATNGEINVHPERKDSVSAVVPAYNKSTSFFDNISSEAREREEGSDSRATARVQRGQEFKKNIETFGQGNVEGGGYRGGYRGRGRGRGYRGGYNRGYSNRGRGRGGAEGSATAI